jgi:intracellular septation protein
MGHFLDFFPLLAFLVAFKVYDIYAATKALMVASVLQVAVAYVWKRKVEPIHLVTLVLALVLGAATLWLRDDRFIKWKPTAVLWLLAMVILGRRLLRKGFSIRPLIVKVSPDAAGIPDDVWRRIDWVWGAALLVAGGANLVKVFGITAVNLALVIYTVIEVQKHQPAEDPMPVSASPRLGAAAAQEPVVDAAATLRADPVEPGDDGR